METPLFSQNSTRYITSFKLAVTILKAKNVKSTNFFTNTSDCFVETQLHRLGSKALLETPPKENSVPLSLKHVTPVVFDATEPQWDETFVFELSEEPQNDLLQVQLFGRHVVCRNTFLGRLEIPVALLLPREIDPKPKEIVEHEVAPRWFKLLPKEGSQDWQKIPGQLQLRFQFSSLPVLITPPPPPPVPQQPVYPPQFLFAAPPGLQQPAPPQFYGQPPAGNLPPGWSYVPVPNSQLSQEAPANIYQHLQQQLPPVQPAPAPLANAPPSFLSSSSSSQPANNAEAPGAGQKIMYKCSLCNELFEPNEIHQHIALCAQAKGIRL